VKQILSVLYLVATAAVFGGSAIVALNTGSIVPTPAVSGIEVTAPGQQVTPQTLVAEEVAHAAEAVEPLAVPEVAAEVVAESAPVVAAAPKAKPVSKPVEKKAEKAFAPAARVAYIDFEEVLMTCDEAKEQIVIIQQEIREKAEELEKRFESLEKKRTSGQINPTDYAKERGYLEVDQRDLESLAQQRQYEIQRVIAPHVIESINKVAEALSLDGVSPKVFYAKESAVITERVRKEMNDAYARSKKEAKFKKTGEKKPAVAKPVKKTEVKPAAVKAPKS